MADKGHPRSDGEATATGRKVPSALDAVMNEPSSEPESDIDVQVVVSAYCFWTLV